MRDSLRSPPILLNRSSPSPLGDLNSYRLRTSRRFTLSRVTGLRRRAGTLLRLHRTLHKSGKVKAGGPYRPNLGISDVRLPLSTTIPFTLRDSSSLPSLISGVSYRTDPPPVRQVGQPSCEVRVPH
jgi:hypothetical protein